MGEYYVFLVLSLLMAGMFLALCIQSGERIPDAIGECWEDELYGILIIPLFLFLSVSALIYTGLQKITYDREKIVFRRFPRREVTLFWRDVTNIECVAGQTSRELILHTQNKAYTIRERQFRIVFPQLLHILSSREP